MNLRNLNFLACAAVAALVSAASTAHAAPVTWTIDSSQSSLKMAIPDFNYTDATLGNLTIRVRNQNTSQNNAWNTGNSAKVGGTIDTNYVDGSSIEFLPVQPNVFGVNSGNYRPNAAAYVGDTNPDPVEASGGSFSNSTTQAAVYGARVRASVANLFGLTVDAAFINFYNVAYELTSGVLGLTGTNSPFAANGVDVGILNTLIGVDGLTVAGQQPAKDEIRQEGGTVDFIKDNQALVGNIADLGLNLRKLTLPVSLTIPLDVGGGIVIPIAFSGQIVATADIPVPEPSTFAMAGIGIVGLMFAARRKFAKRHA